MYFFEVFRWFDTSPATDRLCLRTNDQLYKYVFIYLFFDIIYLFKILYSQFKIDVQQFQLLDPHKQTKTKQSVPRRHLIYLFIYFDSLHFISCRFYFIPTPVLYRRSPFGKLIKLFRKNFN